MSFNYLLIFHAKDISSFKNVLKNTFFYVKVEFLLSFKNANEDVVKMIMGNKCDMEDKRVIPTDRGQEVF